jgi:peptidoglycan/xylan/chitin deacetylase (PgdA/CDA1 family)
MHDSSPTSITAALDIIEELQKQGYTFVTVEEILLE